MRINNTAGLTTTPEPAEPGTPAEVQAAFTESVVAQLDDRIEWRHGDSGWYTPRQMVSPRIKSGQIPTEATGYRCPYGHWRAVLYVATLFDGAWDCTYLIEPTQGNEPCLRQGGTSE